MAGAQGGQAQRRLPVDRAADEHRRRPRRQRRPGRQHVAQRDLARPVEHHAEAAALPVLDEVDDGAAEVRVEQSRRRHEEHARARPGSQSGRPPRAHRCIRVRVPGSTGVRPCRDRPVVASWPCRPRRPGSSGSRRPPRRRAGKRGPPAERLPSGWAGSGCCGPAGFRRLLAVRFAAQWGDGMFQAALGGAVLFNPEREADPLAVAAGLAVVLLPYSVVGPFAGALLDRWDRRRVLLVANLVRAVLTLVVAVIVFAGVAGAAALPRGAGRGRGEPVRAGRALGGAAARRRAAAPRRGERRRRDGRRRGGRARWGDRDRCPRPVRGGRRRLGADHGRRRRRARCWLRCSRRASRPGCSGRTGATSPTGPSWPSPAGWPTAPGPPRARRRSRRRSSRWPRTGWSFGVTTLLTLMLFRHTFTGSGVLRGGMAGVGEAVVAGRGRARPRGAADPVAGAPPGPAAHGADRAARGRGRPSSRSPRG